MRSTLMQMSGGEKGALRRIRREHRTVDVMVRVYCKGHHQHESEGASSSRGAADVCQECAELLGYSLRRIDACPFNASKPACVRCAVHCYRPDMRERIRTVMRYSGPRMTVRHPYLSIRHLLDRRNG